MDFDRLREDLVELNKDPDLPGPEDDEYTGDLAQHIRNQAKRIAGRFTEATETGERNRLSDRYKKLDEWLKQLSAIEAMSPDERDAQKALLRATVLDEFSKWNLGGAKGRAREAEIEMGRRHLLEGSKPGAATHAHRRIRDEIEFLIKNYSPSNEHKIEALIDKWRTSGDPNYDGSVKIRLRNARRRKDQSDYAR